MKYIDKNGCDFGCDFHSPWHKSGENDYTFIVRNCVEKQEKFEDFSTILESELTKNALLYSKNNDHHPFVTWNRPSSNFGYTMNTRDSKNLAFTFETTYFGTENNKVSESNLIELGRCFGRALKKYI